jgi:hypothetical protein
MPGLYIYFTLEGTRPIELIVGLARQWRRSDACWESLKRTIIVRRDLRCSVNRMAV